MQNNLRESNKEIGNGDDIKYSNIGGHHLQRVDRQQRIVEDGGTGGLCRRQQITDNGCIYGITMVR